MPSIPLSRPRLTSLDEFCALFPELETGLRAVFDGTNDVQRIFVVDREDDPAARAGTVLTNIWDGTEAERIRALPPQAQTTGGNDIGIRFAPGSAGDDVCFAFHWNADRLEDFVAVTRIGETALMRLGTHERFEGDRTSVIEKAMEFLAEKGMEDGKVLHPSRGLNR